MALTMADQSVSPYHIVLAQQRRLDVDLLCGLLEEAEQLDVTVASTDILFAQSCCSKFHPALVILDATYPNSQALEIGKAILSTGDAKYLLLLDDDYNLRRAQSAETICAFYYTRNASSSKLLELILQIAIEGHAALNKNNAPAISEQYLRLDCPITSRLTKREIEIMTLLGEGNSVPECAKRLDLASSTVDNHKSRLMKKLDVHKATELVRLAIRAGLVSA